MTGYIETVGNPAGHRHTLPLLSSPLGLRSNSFFGLAIWPLLTGSSQREEGEVHRVLQEVAGLQRPVRPPRGIGTGLKNTGDSYVRSPSSGVGSCDRSWLEPYKDSTPCPRPDKVDQLKKRLVMIQGFTTQPGLQHLPTSN